MSKKFTKKEEEELVPVLDNVHSYVFNIAIKREDGKVENDTMYSDKLLTREDAQVMADSVGCPVLIANIGRLKLHSNKVLKEQTFVCYPAKEENNNGRKEG